MRRSGGENTPLSQQVAVTLSREYVSLSDTCMDMHTVRTICAYILYVVGTSISGLVVGTTGCIIAITVICYQYHFDSC